MKIVFLICVTLLSALNANEESWRLKSIYYSMENDANVETDLNYTHGMQLAALFSRKNAQDSWLNVPFSDINDKERYISFTLSNQMFTQYEKYSEEHLEDDRPYAGWNYVEVALHQVYDNLLDSLTLQVGIVGPSARMEELQHFYHDLIDVRHSTGWHNQIKDEIGVQLNYMRKWHYSYSDFLGLNSTLTPYAGANLGNVSIKASGGALYRVGWNIPKDFGVDNMNEGSFPLIPLHSSNVDEVPSSWSLFFNFACGSNIIARDIFLDGNTFKESKSIEKNYVTAYLAGGISIRYKNFTLNYNHQYYTKEYESRGDHKPYRGYGSAILSYNF